jgi:hypothetical protein
MSEKQAISNSVRRYLDVSVGEDGVKRIVLVTPAVYRIGATLVVGTGGNEYPIRVTRELTRGDGGLRRYSVEAWAERLSS